MNYKKYLLKPLLIVLGVLVALYLIVFIYVSANKRSIIKQVSEKIGEKLNGDVSMKNAELSFLSHFPKVSVQLDDMLIKDSMFSKHGHAFFQSKKLFINLSIAGLLRKKDALRSITVEDGQLYIYTDTSGYTNRYLMEGKKDSTGKKRGGANSVENIRFKNVRLIQDDRRKEKLVDLDVREMDADINTVGNNMSFDVSLKAFVHQLGFNLARGSYLVNKKLEGDFEANYNTKENRLSFKDVPMDIDDHRFNLAGEFVFLGQRHFMLDVETKELEYQLGLSVLTKRLAKNISKFSYDKPIDIHAHIVGPLGGGEPLVVVKWVAKNTTVTTPLVTFTKSSFTGGFVNEEVKGIARTDENSRIEIHNFTGNWEGFELASKNIYIDNLTVPIVTCDLRSDFSLATLNNLLQSSTIELQQGTGSMNINYKGPLMPDGTVTPIANGNIMIRNGLVNYIPRNVQLKNCNATISFAGTDVAVKNMHFKVNENDITMNGSAAGLLTLIKSSPDKIVFDWNIFTPALDLGSFTNLLKPRNKKVVVKKSSGKLSKLSNQLDNMLEKGSVRVRMKANNLHYKKFDATNVNAAISLVEDNWTLSNVSLNHAGGNMNLSGTIREMSNLFHQVNIRSNMNNVDIKKIMYSFGNFGQTGIESNNLTGKLTADATLAMQLNRQLVQPENMTGGVNFSLKNGSLINYEPMQKMQSFFKHRDFSNIRFAELKDRLDFNNKEIVINRMEIQSTVLTLFVEGVYSLKGNTDISIQFPLSNIKRRDSTYIPQNVGNDAKAGMSIYLRGKPGSDGKIQFKPDVLAKFRKKPKAG
jgi:hypothetical protein